MNSDKIIEEEIKRRFEFYYEPLFHIYTLREAISSYDPEILTELFRTVIFTLKKEDNISLRIMKAMIDILIDIDKEPAYFKEKIESIYLTSIEKGFEEVNMLFLRPPPVMIADPRDFEEWDVELCKVTLGERKSFAKRLERNMIERLLKDPTPEVIRILLTNPRLFESDVISLGARRPNFAPVLLEIYRSYKWRDNRRIITTLVRNPYTYPSLSIKLAFLLPKTELLLVRNDMELHPAVRDVTRFMLS